MSKFIQFHHAQAGKIAINQGATCLSDLLIIGALAHTKKIVFPEKKTAVNLYQTDHSGLEFIRNRNDQIVEFLLDSITGVSLLMASHREFVFDEEVTPLAELLAGLSHLVNVLSSENQEVTHALLIGKNKEVVS